MIINKIVTGIPVYITCHDDAGDFTVYALMNYVDRHLNIMDANDRVRVGDLQEFTRAFYQQLQEQFQQQELSMPPAIQAQLNQARLELESRRAKIVRPNG